jgi:hypothetical protein
LKIYFIKLSMQTFLRTSHKRKKNEKYVFLKHGMAEVISFVLENSFVFAAH